MRTSSSSGSVDLLILAVAMASGFAIEWIDTRPNWDDAGITAGLLLLTSGALALIAPRRAWAIALAVGFWIPLHAMVTNGLSSGTLAMLLILLFPLAGAYGARGIRTLAGGAKAP